MPDNVKKYLKIFMNSLSWNEKKKSRSTATAKKSISKSFTLVQWAASFTIFFVFLSGHK